MQYLSSRLTDRAQRGAASLVVLFAMSAFSVLGIASLSTGLGSAPAGKSFSIMKGVPQEALTKFVADMAVPNEWRTEGAEGTQQFQLPVLVPENGNDESGTSGAWHNMNAVPGMTVCCETRAGVCGQRKDQEGRDVEDWTPGAGDTMRLALQLTTKPDSASGNDVVTATVLSGETAPAPDTTAVACQLEFDGAVIAKGMGYFRQVPRQNASELRTDLIEGTFNLAVRTK